MVDEFGWTRGALGSAVEVRDHSAMIHRHDRIECGIDDRCLSQFALASELFEAFALEVESELAADHADGAKQLVIRRLNVGTEELHYSENCVAALQDRVGVDSDSANCWSSFWLELR